MRRFRSLVLLSLVYHHYYQTYSKYEVCYLLKDKIIHNSSKRDPYQTLLHFFSQSNTDNLTAIF